jgi:Bardet-Biedl syndrome 7 protein
VDDTKIWTGCEYIYNSYENGTDVSFYMAHDQIHSMVMDYVTRDSIYDAILGCQDNCIRVVSDSTLSMEVDTDASVLTLRSLKGEDGNKAKSDVTPVVFGSDKGSLMGIAIDGRENNAMWKINDTKNSVVSCIKVFDITQDGNMEIVVGRDDGRLEVFCQDRNQSVPSAAFTRDLGESIRALECGRVNSTDFNEVVVAGYSGKILSFTSEPTQDRAPDDSYGRTVQTVNNENRIKHLKKELDALKQKVEKEKGKIQHAKAKTGNNASSLDIARAGNVDFPINSTFILNVEKAAYALTIEIQSPIDLVIIRSPVHIELIDADVGSAVVSLTPESLIASSQDGSPADYCCIATYRLQHQEKRLSVLVRTMEGEFGELQATVVSAQTPKAAKVIRYTLQPLSLHTRVHSFEDEEDQRPRNSIKFVGSVSLAIFHEWVAALLPGVPSRIDEDSNGEEYYFQSVYSGAVTLCYMKKNELTFESESVSTIAIIKENILRFAINRRIELSDTTSCNPDTVGSFLSLIREKLEYQLSLTRKMELIDAIQEITLQEPDTRWLSVEYAEILRDKELIRKEFGNREKSLEVMSGVITDLFVDWHKLRGVDARAGIPALMGAIQTAFFEELVQMILNY